ncbi:MAG TPA: hypothetical protein VM600_03180, partial [Actinomycetota bacterium]|nr:hypothetical protein [Actinomycetota bacterium]
MRDRTSLPARAVLLAVGLALAAPAPGASAIQTAPDECRKAIAVDSPPVGTGSCPGVRPGALVQSALGYCTMNFLFTGSDGHRYIGT